MKSRPSKYRTSGLALVTAAIALSNIVYLGVPLVPCTAAALVAGLAPVGWRYINPTGDYL